MQWGRNRWPSAVVAGEENAAAVKADRAEAVIVVDVEDLAGRAAGPVVQLEVVAALQADAVGLVARVAAGLEVEARRAQVAPAVAVARAVPVDRVDAQRSTPMVMVVSTAAKCKTCRKGSGQ